MTGDPLYHRIMAVIWVAAAIIGVLIHADGTHVLILLAVSILHSCTASILQAIEKARTR